jgi:hypothetical protein
VADPSEAVPGSFRDPRGYVFRRDGVLLRHVDATAEPDYELFESSGLRAALHDGRLLIPHEEDPALAIERGAARVLRPEVVPFVSYPYEWSFSQLRDAALLTLRLQETAMDHGMSLRDASAYNVQFHRGGPMMIDTLSFERLPEGRPWVAYRQFCQHFLAPLALMSYRDVRLGLLLRDHLDGVPLDLAASLLPRRAQARPPLQLHVFLHAKSQRRHADDGAAHAAHDEAPDESKDETRRRSFGAKAFRGLLDSLRKGVEGLGAPEAVGAWADYEAEATHYTEAARRRKEEIVAAWIERAAPASVWDLGANVGRFSRMASTRGIDTVSFDLDAAAVDRNYAAASEERDERLLPLVMDLTNPSPGLGWDGSERASLAERGPADLALALALVHHLAIGNNVPLPMLLGTVAGLARRAVVEFVPKDDEKVRTLLATREDVFPDYTVEGFESAAAASFEIEARESLPDSGRVLYLMRAR